MNQVQPQTLPVSVAALLELSLSQWQELHANLENAGAPVDEIDYCEEKINTLVSDIFDLKNRNQQ